MATWTPSMEDVFGILSDKMQSYFERTKKSVERPDEKGAPREEIVLEFFKDFMPSSIGVEKGYAINLNGDHSRECDIIFYRKNTSPIFKISPTSNLYIIPIEDIYGAIEVKSSLTQTQIKNCLLKKTLLRVVSNAEMLTKRNTTICHNVKISLKNLLASHFLLYFVIAFNTLAKTV